MDILSARQYELDWLLGLGFAVSFLLAFAMGANDCANSFGTVVGSRVLSLPRAYAIATVSVTCGAALLGYRVTETLRLSLLDLGRWDVVLGNGTRAEEGGGRSSAQLGVVVLGSAVGAAVWTLGATAAARPVSVTQATVGGLLGAGLVSRGPGALRWRALAKVGASWLLSPLISAILGSTFYLLIKEFCLCQKKPFEASLLAFPFIVFLTIVSNGFAILFHGSKYIGLDQLLWWEALIISAGTGVVIAALLQCCAIKVLGIRATALFDREVSEGVVTFAMQELESPFMKLARIQHLRLKFSERSHNHVGKSQLSTSEQSFLTRIWTPQEEDAKACKVFHYLQILSACFLSFAHGANDTANAVSGLVSLWALWSHGSASASVGPPLVLEGLVVFGAASMVAGLWLGGHRVMRTVGADITHISAPFGFAVEMGAALTVILGSLCRLPLSSTHCLVGGLAVVGWVRSREAVRWRVLGGITSAWLVTIPAAGAIAALFTHVVSLFFALH